MKRTRLRYCWNGNFLRCCSSYAFVYHNSAGWTDIETTFDVLSNEDLQDIVIDNVMNILQSKGYMGVVLSAQYIDTQNQYLFANYAQNFSDRLTQRVIIPLLIDPNVSSTDGTVTYEDPIIQL